MRKQLIAGFACLASVWVGCGDQQGDGGGGEEQQEQDSAVGTAESGLSAGELYTIASSEVCDRHGEMYLCASISQWDVDPSKWGVQICKKQVTNTPTPNNVTLTRFDNPFF